MRCCGNIASEIFIKLFKAGKYLFLLHLIEKPACNMPAAQHQFKVIELFKLCRVYFLYYLPVPVIHEHHDMRQLQSRVPLFFRE